ncbi:TetR family transcriptional regulator [Paraburkholderia aspalathi]|uniref:TetR family transcriptional regulator n=1 Tax=Paraburkholderia aspalathi TaxID=1324617 RepID=UPI00190CC8AE|nr:TetR family transcriptional regulator [Paraburkholderia aspalathi]MBK3843314.1 TetR family transcriptional regulator [Paraburkholderia aspalathi]
MAAKQKSTTRRRLELALRRLQHGKMQSSSDDRISIAAVAREAGVSNATIHNRYPDIAERVRALHVKASRLKTKAMPDTMDVIHRKLREAHQEIDRLKTDLVNSQSINLRLTRENELLHSRLLKK